MKLNTLFTLVAAGMFALSATALAGAKSYQVTGPVVEVTDSMIVVTKGKERFESIAIRTRKLPVTSRLGRR